MKTAGKLALGGVAAGLAATVGMALVGRTAYKQLRRWRSSDSQRNDLQGKTVLITGGSRGLGLALAEEFARQGCNIALCARDEAEMVRARQQVERLGVEVVAVTCDVSKQEQVDHMVQVVRQHFGAIDVLVNNAGVISVGPLLSQRIEDYKEAMDIMFWGAVYPTLAVMPQMIESGSGEIVNITSIGGKVSVPHLIPYGCAKFATVGFSEGLHAELKKFGINVLTVVPGLMRTGSDLNAYFKGQQKYEYGWFALSGTNPLFSISVERAARQIVQATRRRKAELVVSWQAKLLAKVHGIAPGLTSEALALVNQLLPNAEGGSTQRKTGRDSQSVVTRSPLTALGRRAAKRYNQLGEIA
jgi:short-subunit dehydrogenase